MDLNAETRDTFPVSPTQISQKPDDEGVGLLHSYSLSTESHSEKGSAEYDNTKSWDPSGGWRKVLIASLAVLAFLGLVTVVAVTIHFVQPPSRLQPLGELNGLIPEFPLRKVTFHEDRLATPDHKTEESANATAEYWLSFMPVGRGFIHIDNPDQYTLPAPVPGDSDNAPSTYSISVFHQLHCLHNIMTMYNTLAAAINNPNHNQQTKPHHFHIDHCFRYLRQAILCCGDTALEGVNPDYDPNDRSGHGPPLADGTGAAHVCKDYEAIKKWAEGRRVDDVWEA